ncbi:Dynein light chain 2, cytoplasmic [Morella rubra]|uniref:Dynein light chain n=1 Tax=Morella rubra TaxID=262757 RepID=A0A6A1VTG5_9ROSI|nr:Dynein light chain 2, cytoplasmic [Morella rubra]
MSEDAKRAIQGGLMVKPPSSDDRKPSAAAAAAATPPSGKRVIIKSADMLPDMQKEAIDTAIAAFEKHSVEKDVAEHIKKEFDQRHGSTWHCIVGRNFGNPPFPSLPLLHTFRFLDCVSVWVFVEI